MPDPDRNRRIVGGGCLVVGCSLGGIVFLLEMLGQTMVHSDAALWSVVIAFVPVLLYGTLPYFLDSYDPEPWWALLGVFLWGAFFATGVSGIFNTIVQKSIGGNAGMFVAMTFSAPFIEEITKGMAILGIVIFLRREFDGVVDGVIYGTLVGIGFATVENIGYYFRYRADMGMIFLVRGVLTPWLHPLFTSMTGVGFGLGREHGASWAKVVFPLAGLSFAMLLHAIWNGSGFFFGGGGRTALFVKCGIGIVFALAFLCIVIALVVRKGRTIRRFLQDEVLIGNLSEQELTLITTPFGRIRARMMAGSVGSDFVRAGARLALSKWHSARAMKGQKMTISADFIVPLRQELARLRSQIQVRN